MSKASQNDGGHVPVPGTNGAGFAGRIEKMSSEFTPAERRIADAVIASPEAFVLATITDIAERSGGSEAAVSRFARKIGYANFAEFKLALARDVVPETRSVYGDVEPGDDAETVLAKVAATNIRAIDDAVHGLDQVSLVQAARRISSARRVAFFGSDGSAIVAQDAMSHFLRVLANVVQLVDLHEQTIWAARCGEGDVLVLSSDSEDSRGLSDLAEIASSRGGFVIVITHQRGRGALTNAADLSLHTSARDRDALSSRIAAFTLVDVLYALVALEQRKGTAADPS